MALQTRAGVLVLSVDQELATHGPWPLLVSTFPNGRNKAGNSPGHVKMV